MSDIVLVAIIATVPGVLTAAVGYCAVHKKTNDLKVHINSRMDQLLAVSNAAKFAEGKIEGRSEATIKAPVS
jgi:hypothetical protein